MGDYGAVPKLIRMAFMYLVKVKTQKSLSLLQVPQSSKNVKASPIHVFLGEWGYCQNSCFKNRQTTERSTSSRPTINISNSKPNIKDTRNGQYQPNEEDETCGLYLGAGFIIGGKDTKRGELPYLANLGYKSIDSGNISYGCGGTLINR